jgi:uncharacterized protein YifE (UPF0438 family)
MMNRSERSGQMSNHQPEHVEQPKRRPFRFGCSTDVFPPEEIRVLSEHGHWMEALAAGTIAPINPEHEHFLRVDREETEPSNVGERAWLRLKGRREFEREQQMAPPPTPPEDYGIIEWDKEKCWW